MARLHTQPHNAPPAREPRAHRPRPRRPRADAELVARHLPLARRAASRVYPRVRDRVAFDEVLALASAGLADAARRFDPARGASFATFAWYRIHGAIVDGLRRSTELPRRTRLRGQRGDALDGPHAAAADEAQPLSVLSLEALCDSGFEAAAEVPAPSEGVERAWVAARLREAVARLPGKERAIVARHYFDGVSLLEAGAELGLSKSWASRLHAQAVERLRGLVEGWAP